VLLPCFGVQLPSLREQGPRQLVDVGIGSQQRADHDAPRADWRTLKRLWMRRQVT
jgi:hypothetical protein